MDKKSKGKDRKLKHVMGF